MTTAPNKPADRTSSRLIDPGTPPTRFARGWHCLGMADGFRDAGRTRSRPGTKLVVWADSAGRLQVIDGYCRHLGGDLGQGSIKGDEVACPFHDWRWGGDGRCKQIPTPVGPPARRPGPGYAMERNHQLFVWHDPELKPRSSCR